jgi:hypothetical protein
LMIDKVPSSSWIFVLWPIETAIHRSLLCNTGVKEIHTIHPADSWDNVINRCYCWGIVVDTGCCSPGFNNAKEPNKHPIQVMWLQNGNVLDLEGKTCCGALKWAFYSIDNLCTEYNTSDNSITLPLHWCKHQLNIGRLPTPKSHHGHHCC